jgi:DNA (cytosine-5)-methyltransferase 1
MRLLVEASSGLLSIGTGTGHRYLDVTDLPMPAVLAGRPVRLKILETDTAMPATTKSKPPYLVPTMAEIEAVRASNGYNVVSTFSGCGGSCLGFEMEGFAIRWASEFIPEARATYGANHPATPVDDRDIRTVAGDDILLASGMAAGEVDVLEGSPPCSSFSTAGKREKGWGKVKAYSDGAQRTDDLFFEFARLVDDLRPRVFVAENVAGLVRGTAIGYFKEIHRRLAACGYRVEARLLDAQWLGVPQARQRVIFMGVREDLDQAPRFPAPLPYRYSIRDALPHLGRVVHDTSGLYGAGDVTDRPCPAVTVGVNSLNSTHFKVEEPGDSTLAGTAIGREWQKLRPGESSDRYFNLVRPHPDRPCPAVTQTAGVRGAAGVTHPSEPRKFYISELLRTCGFPDDFVLTGTYRQQWERLGRAVPPVMMARVASCVRGILDASCRA